MAEMGFAGLSEPWLMRRAGDLHWRLIARAMGQSEALFTCARGEPLYAAFCATRLTIERPGLPRLGGALSMSGRLHRVGRGRYGSVIELFAAGAPVGRVELVTAFVGRGPEGGNRTLVRRAPRVLAVPAGADPALDALARDAARGARAFRAAPDDGAGRWFLPCPALDFNAAGLLYFPSFAALADRAAFEAGHRAGPVRRRAVCHLGNVEPGERLRVTRARRRQGWLDAIRGEDGRPLALLRGTD
ncbi:hypothetical protein FJM51_08320 [Amaricoccus solimangrovi]|uniref:Biosynthetic protein, Pnap_2097 family n=2 Tax=Amaricoccus solimangrovi TaxID=2589815 RepID=A0A501WQZ1_9RHOB|nr:hypothetical protein FJM51_08320 [Amaricoccus solimangrovi]